MDKQKIIEIWETHKSAGWPRMASRLEGPLMTLDTVISGCAVYFLDSPEGLDEQRRIIVGDCLTDLESLESEIDDEHRPYFQRLHELGTLLLLTP